MRNLETVIDKIIPLIPPTEESFIRGFQSIKSSYQYCAPELVLLQWERGVELLHAYLGTGKLEGWQLSIAKIWLDKEDV